MTENNRPSADQTSTGLDQGRIVHEYTLTDSNDPGPGEKKIIINVPPECEHMTAAEFIEYSKEHPEAWDSFANSLHEAIAPAIDAAVKAMTGVERVKETIQKTTAVFYDVSNIVKSITKTLLNLPQWADPEAIEKIYAELEELEPYLNAEIAKRPGYEGKTFFELFDGLEFVDALFFVAPADVLKENPPEVDPDRLAIINDLLEVREAARAARNAAQETKLLPQLRGTGIPKSFLFHNSVFTNALRAIDGKGELIGAGAVDLPAYNIGKPNEITILAQAWMDEEYKLTTEKPFTAYNEAVMNGAATLYADRAGRGLLPIVTDAEIYRAINHMPPGSYVTPAQRGAVAKSMSKLNSTWASIDATDQIKKLKVTDPDTGKPLEGLKRRGRLLNYEIIDVDANGQTVRGYYILNEPIAYTHARLTKQVITINAALLDIKETRRENGKIELLESSISNTPVRIAIRMYIIKRVEVMRKDEERAIDSHRKEVRKCEAENKKGTPSKPRPIGSHRRQTRTILFESVFTAAEITKPSRKTEAKKYVFSVLDFLEGSGRITSWKARKPKGKAPDAVEIII